MWTPTALPIRDETASYQARHGQGYSRFLHGSHGIALELLQFVPVEDPIKISRLTLRNDSDRVRRLSVTAYAEWVLGSSRSATAPYIITEMEPQSKAILARSAWNGEFGGRIAFADLRGQQTSFTGDRTRIFRPQRHCRSSRGARTRRSTLGQSGSGPRSLRRAADHDRVAPGRARRSRIFPGPDGKQEQARDLLMRYRTADLDKVLGEVTRRWDDILDTVQVYHARSQHGCAAESLAALSNAFLPRLGPRRLLPGERRVRIPRPAAGRDGAERRETRSGARTIAARGRAPIPRRRRPALVASAVGPRHSHAHVRRSAVAALRRRPVHRSHRRHDRARRDPSRFSKAICWRKGRTNRISSRAFRKLAPRFSSTARAPSTAASASAATACRSWARAIGTTA